MQTVLPTGINRAVFEEEVLVVMRSEGDIVAWKVLSHPDATLHAMVVEFNDAERAQAVIAKLNNYAQPLGPPMNVSATFPLVWLLSNINKGQVRAAAVSMSLHWPDVIERQMIALNNEVAQDGASALHFGTAGTGQAPTNNMGMGAVVYGPAAAPTHQLQVPVHDVGSSRSVPNPYGHFGQVPPPFQSQAGHGPPEQRHRQLNHYNPRGRKHGKGYNGNPMFSPNDLPHNHVVCMAIEQGKDVRPTVCVLNSVGVMSADLHPGHGPKYPEQDDFASVHGNYQQHRPWPIRLRISADRFCQRLQVSSNCLKLTNTMLILTAWAMPLLTFWM